jgi:hypothetical protein
MTAHRILPAVQQQNCCSTQINRRSEAELWETVCRLRAQSQAHRAADDPAQRVAIEEWDACFNKTDNSATHPTGNVIAFRKTRAHA